MPEGNILNSMIISLQKHQNEFKEKDAMIELGKYIQKYSVQVRGFESMAIDDCRVGLTIVNSFNAAHCSIGAAPPQTQWEWEMWRKNEEEKSVKGTGSQFK